MDRRKFTVCLVAICFLVIMPWVLEAQTDYYPPPESQGGWRSLVSANSPPTAAQKTSILNTTGLNWEKLLEAWNYCQSFGGPNSVLVIRNGWIVAEWHNYLEPHGIASCTKSLTGLAMAKLFDLSDSGRFSERIGMEDYAYRYLPASWGDTDPRRKQIRIRHLMTMCSGLDPYDGPYTENYSKVVLSQLVKSPPETVWAYASVPVDLLSLIIENVTGEIERDFFNQEINADIGVPTVAWPDFGGHTGGSGGPGGGAKFDARNLARIGYLMLQKGAWNNGDGLKQIVSRERVSQITQWASFLQNATYLIPNFAFERDAKMYYGYLWWTNHTQQSLGPAVPKDTFYMSGWGKQACWIVPSLHMVVVRLGSNRVLNGHPEYYAEFWSRVMAAVVTP